MKTTELNAEDAETQRKADKPPLPEHITLPEGVRYDGVIAAPRLGRTLLHFTDTKAGPARGASFSIESQYLTTATLNRKLREVRHSFRILPLSQRAPMEADPAGHYYK